MIHFAYIGSLVLLSIGPLYMGAGPIVLCGSEQQEPHTHTHRHGCHRHRPASHHAHWLGSPATSRWWNFRYRPTPLETGVMKVLAGPGLSTHRMSSFRKGVRWLLLATAAGIPPIVRRAPSLLAFFSFISISRPRCSVS